MFKIIFMWNSSKPAEDMEDSIANIEYRGYNSKKTGLTSQFANRISKKNIRPLSVRHVSDKYCPTRRDLYYERGSNIKYRRKGRIAKKWGRAAGIFSQDYLASLFLGHINKKDSKTYAKLTKGVDGFSLSFIKGNKTKFKELKRLGLKEYEDTDYLLKILKINAIMEMGGKLINNILSKNGNYIAPSDLSLEYQDHKVELCPNPKEIGINKPSTPDFLIEKSNIIGDIKTGVYFSDRYPLTCAGYALAYENWKKKEKKDINWGVIYFLPTRIPTDYAKPVTYAQLYIFPIDDILRGWFLKERDIVYEIVSKKEPPTFPKNREKCKGCYYCDICKKWGLVI